MREVPEGIRDAVQGVAGGEKRGVKRLAVERYQSLPGREKLGERLQQSRFLGGVAHEELLEHEIAVDEARRPHQEGVGAGTASEAGCLGIQKDKGREVE